MISTGWLSTISWQSIVALDCYLVGTIVQSLVIINNESYSATRWQATLLIFASVIGIGIFNIFGTKHLPLAEGIFVAAHFLAFFPIIVVILVLAPKTTPTAVFLTFTDNGSGWPTVAWATLVGQVSQSGTQAMAASWRLQGGWRASWKQQSPLKWRYAETVPTGREILAASPPMPAKPASVFSQETPAPEATTGDAAIVSSIAPLPKSTV